MVQYLHRNFVVLYKMYRILMVWSGNRRRPPLPKERPVGSREISYSTASLHPVGVMMILIEMMIVCLIQGVYKMISA